ncbi:tyrosine-type recombinase/integrase (plasmid) [Haloferacaceae archaeon DSL9]
MRPDETALDEPLAAFLRSKSTDGHSGNYRQNLERSIRQFLDWLDRHDGPQTFGDLDAAVFRRYARHLRDERELAPGTVLTYYAEVSAYVGWCVREGLLEQNYAQRNEAKEPLPSGDGRRSGDQQAWTDEHRRRITRHVDRAARAAVDGRGFDAIAELRDRAIVYTLCYTGVRGGEIFAAQKDDRRRGLRWRDVDIANNTITVLSKKQKWSDRSLPAQAAGPMRRYLDALRPATDEWPVFVSLHSPSLYEAIRSDLGAERAGDVLADATGAAEALAACRDRGVTPPPLSTHGARSVMKRLCGAAEIEIDDKHGYLAPHGGRRGAGEVMVRQRGFTAAARLLDNSEGVVRKSYSHIEAKEIAKDAGDAFDEYDGR